MTTLLPPVVLGSQQPRVLNGPSFSSSAGQEAIDLAASVGLFLDPWQQILLEQMLGERPDGRWAAREAAFLVARQNGKGAVLEARELAGLFLFGDRLILHSAHEFKTAQEAFLRTMAWIDGSDALRKRCKKPRTSHGEEGFELLNGARLRYVARSRSSGRGFTVDTAILDEAQELAFLAVNALIPTMRTSPNPQTIYCGTVPTPENNSEQWTAIRDRGRAGTSGRLMWAEWNPGEKWDDLDDHEAWLASNPGVGFRTTMESLADDREALAGDPAGFAREVLSIWPSDDEGASALIPGAVWQSLAVEQPPPNPAAELVFAIDVSPERHTSIGLAEQRPDGLVLLEVVDYGDGTDWAPGRCRELRDRWSPLGFVLDPSGPAGSLLADLANVDGPGRPGIQPTLTGARDMANACGSWYDAVTARPDPVTGVGGPTVRHAAQAELDAAVAIAKRRPLTDAWALDRKGSVGDISPLVSVVLARWGLLTIDRPKPPPAKPVGGAESEPDNILTMGF